MEKAGCLDEPRKIDAAGKEKRVPPEMDPASAYNLLREKVIHAFTHTKEVLLNFENRLQTQAQTTRSAIRDMHKHLKDINERFDLLEGNVSEVLAKICFMRDRHARSEELVDSIKKTLLMNVIQVDVLSQTIDQLNKDITDKTAHTNALVDRAVQNLLGLREDTKEIRASQARFIKRFRRKLRGIEHLATRYTKKGSSAALASPSPASEYENRYLNDIASNSRIVVGVFSDKAEIPPKNEDFGVTFSDGKIATASVCDGVGSSKNGAKCAEQAARSFLASSKILAGQRKRERLDTHEALRKCFDRAMGAIAGQESHESTMVAAVMDAATGQFSLGWMGDGTALLISGKGVKELLRPHRNGRHEITTFVSGDGRGGIGAEMENLSLEPGQVVLLASDGFGDLELDNEILCRNVLAAVNADIPAKEVCAKLVRDAVVAGADDNVTVALIGLRNLPPLPFNCGPALVARQSSQKGGQKGA